MESNVKWLRLGIIVILAIICWNISPPEGLKLTAWHSLVLFIATIICIVVNVLPIGAIGIIAITVYVVLNAGGDATAADAIKTGLRNINNSTIWLIVVAFLIARGFIKTGLGRRVALVLITLLGRRTLGLAYGLALADMILAPAMPSNTARCGGVLYPIADSLARSFESRPDDASRSKIGTFLVTCMGNINDVTSAMFMTAFTGNLLIVKLAANENISLTWSGWLLAAAVPCLVSFILIPLVIYFVTARPEIKHTPNAPNLAKQQLTEMGQMSKSEWLMAGTVVVLLALWIFYQVLGIDPTAGAFIGLSILLLTGVLSWKDVISEKGAWDTLIWFAALLMMADQLKDLGFMSWFGNTIGQEIHSLAGSSSWVLLLVLLNAVYLYAHYFFASGNAQIVALYSVFLTLGIQLGVPGIPMALMLALSSSFSCSLTQYTHARGPILFGPGYVPTTTWWATGLVCSVVNQIVLLTIGLAWWKILGLY
jgi:DASS family divalent anion:Na+ symporter